jgi:hypothetical protein
VKSGLGASTPLRTGIVEGGEGCEPSRNSNKLWSHTGGNIRNFHERKFSGVNLIGN